MAHNIDESQLRQWWNLYNPDGKLMEVRLLGKNTYSGYFKDYDTLLSQLSPMLDENNVRFYGNMQAYFVLNEINPELYGREQHDMFVKKPKATTTDNDIIRRRFFFIDLDPVRSAGISSSDAELEKAHLKSVDIYRFLSSVGFPEPIVAISGNGYRLTYACDIIPSEESDKLLKSFLEALARRFSDNEVDIDCKVYNRSRIDKIIGTWAKKGSDGTDRKWRLARFVKIPSEVKVTPIELFQKAIDALPPAPAETIQPANTRSYSGEFSLPAWLQAHGIEYREKVENGITKYQLRRCPWEDSHSSHQDWASAICRMPDGKIVFTCFHAHCRQKTWADVRRLYEPEYVPYSERQPQQQPQTVIIQQAPARPSKHPQIIPESPELGHMWLDFDEIESINLDALPSIPTGVSELDRRIVGLYLSEVSIISGSNSSGKSSFLNSLLLNAVSAGFRCALWSGELRPDVLKTWLFLVAAGRRHVLPSQTVNGRFYVPDNISRAIATWLHGKLQLFNNAYGAKWEQIFSQMEVKAAEGFKLFVLDNLMALDIDLLGDTSNKAQKGLIERLGKFAKEARVHIILVAHPRKSSGRGINSFLRKDDIAGTSDLGNLADNVFIIHRNNGDFRRGLAEYYGKEFAAQYEPEAVVKKDQEVQPRGAKWQVGNVIEVCKNRMYGVVDELVDLYFEPESRRFLNAPGELKEYAWNINEASEGGFKFTPRPTPPPAALDDELPFEMRGGDETIPF